MAQKAAEELKIEWKSGQKCEVYNEFKKEWIEGKVVDVFKDEEGEWVKVRFGRNTTEIPPDSRDIRLPSNDHPLEHAGNDRDIEIPSDDAQLNGQSKWETGSKCQMYCVETMKWIDGEIISVFIDEMGEWLRVQSGQRIYDVMNRDPPLRVPGAAPNSNDSGTVSFCILDSLS